MSEEPQKIKAQPIDSHEAEAKAGNLDSDIVANGQQKWWDDASVSTKPLTPQDVGVEAKEVFESPNDQEPHPPSLQAAHNCHLGNLRSRNEDSTFLFTAEAGGQDPLLRFGLYVVADGMGGHYAGHEASRTVSRLVASYVIERIYLPLLESGASPGSAHQQPILEVMIDAIQRANIKIHNPEPGKDSGTTLTAALIFGQRVYIAHVGDSRAYLLAEGNLSLMTTDHSYVQRLQDAGQLSKEEAAVHPQRNMLYKAVGQGGNLEIDTFTRSLPSTGMLVLCSDGLWGLVDDPEIQDVVMRDISIRAKADLLVAMARRAGGHDNISIILAEFGM